MDERTKLLISLGAAVAANCVPCFEHYLARTETSGVTPEEIQEAAKIGDQVKSGARIVMRRSIREIVQPDKTSCNSQSDGICCG